MTAKQTMTADQLFARSSELGRCELLKGELITMSPAGGGHGRVAAKLAFYFQEWAFEHGCVVYGADTVNRCVTVHLPSGDAHVYRSGDTVTAGEVMTDLSVAVGDLFS